MERSEGGFLEKNSSLESAPICLTLPRTDSSTAAIQEPLFVLIASTKRPARGGIGRWTAFAAQESTCRRRKSSGEYDDPPDVVLADRGRGIIRAKAPAAAPM